MKFHSGKSDYIIFLLCLLFSGILYVLHLQNEQQSEYIEVERKNLIELNNQFEKKHAELLTELNKQKEIVSIIGESINPKDKRWASVKKIREVIQDTIKKNHYPKYLNIKELTHLASAILEYSEQYDISPALIVAVIRKESAFNPRAVSTANAQGLMQLIPDTAQECARDVQRNFYNIFKIRDNVQLGTWYLWKMLNTFKGDVGLAVQAYNAGPVYVKKFLAQESGFKKLPSETVNYHHYVLEWYKEYQNLGL